MCSGDKDLGVQCVGGGSMEPKTEEHTTRVWSEDTRCAGESSLVGFGCLDDNLIKGLLSVLSLEQVLSEKLTWLNTSELM